MKFLNSFYTACVYQLANKVPVFETTITTLEQMKKLGSREITVERGRPNPGRVASFLFCIPYFPLTKSSDSQTDLQKQTGVAE